MRRLHRIRSSRMCAFAGQFKWQLIQIQFRRHFSTVMLKRCGRSSSDLPTTCATSPSQYSTRKQQKHYWKKRVGLTRMETECASAMAAKPEPKKDMQW